MEKRSVVTVFVTRRTSVLVVKRSEAVGTYRGLWSGISGYLETDEPIEQAWVELAEELSLGPRDVRPEKAGEPLDIIDRQGGRSWKVHPFRFTLFGTGTPRLDWENTEMRWVRPAELPEMRTVPGLWDAWKRVANGFETQSRGRAPRNSR